MPIPQNNMENELFEKIGKLYLETTNVEIYRERIDRCLERADKLAYEVINLEQQILANKGTLPDFCLHSPVSNGRSF
jgi:hypothetical protein